MKLSKNEVISLAQELKEKGMFKIKGLGTFRFFERDASKSSLNIKNAGDEKKIAKCVSFRPSSTLKGFL